MKIKKGGREREMEKGQEGREKGGKGNEKGEELHYTIEIQNFSETFQINLFLGSGFWEKNMILKKGGWGVQKYESHN